MLAFHYIFFTLLAVTEGYLWPQLLPSVPFLRPLSFGPGPVARWDKHFDWDEMLLEPVSSLEEKEQEYSLSIKTPGKEFPKEKIDVSVENGIFTVKGDYSEESRDSSGGCYSKHFESFSRSMRLPENVDQEQIKANYKDGTLSITFPKKPALAKEVKKITVE